MLIHMHEIALLLQLVRCAVAGVPTGAIRRRKALTLALPPSPPPPRLLTGMGCVCNFARRPPLTA